MGQGIQDFYAAASARGFSRDYQLRVAQIGGIVDDTTLVYARTAQLPARSIETQTLGFKGFKLNVPMQVSYDSTAWTLKIYCDEAMLIRQAFEKTSIDTFNEHTMRAIENDRMIQLNVLNDQGDTVMIYKIYSIIIQKIGEISYDLGGNGAPQSFDLTFAYQYWTSESVKIPNKNKSQGPLTGLQQGIQGATNVVRGIRNVGSTLGIG
jgi:hypothetical protein